MQTTEKAETLQLKILLMALVVVVAALLILLAAVLTYLWEKPMHRWILSWGQKQKEPIPAQADTISESTERK